MQTQRIEKTADRSASATPEANVQLWAERPASLRLSAADRGITELSAQLVRADGERLGRGLEACLEILGRVFPADRVIFYRTDDSGTDFAAPSMIDGFADVEESGALFRASKLWFAEAGTPPAGYSRPTLSLADFPDHGKALLEGQTSGGPPSLDAGVARRWQVARSTLFIPCPGEDGLFGLFEVHAAASGPIESEAAIDRAALAARVLGAALDRANLRSELTSLQQDQKRGTRLETLGRVASSVAHDFNNVLTAILGYTDLLEMEIEDYGNGQSELGEIRQAATRAAKLVDQVLTFGRTRTAGNKPVDLAETIGCLEGMLRQVLGEGIALDFDWLERAPKVELDRARFGPVLMNLASNARGALASQDVAARFALTTHLAEIDERGFDTDSHQSVPGAAAGSYLVLTARDNGCGIDPEIADRIFEPFFTTKDPGAGTGLGLASLTEFVGESDGWLRMESAPGQGTAFHLYFPVEARESA